MVCSWPGRLSDPARIEIFTRFVKIKDLPRPYWRGFFFCLASAEGAGLLFCPATMQPHINVYNGFSAVNQIIPPTPQNSAQGFTVAFPVIVPAQPPTIIDRHNKPLHRLRHVGAHHSTATPPAHTRYHRHARTLYRTAQPPCYNKVYKGATDRRPCKPGGVSMLPTPGISLASCFLPGTAARNH